MMVDLLARALGIGKKEMINKMDKIYRIHTNYARRHNLPKKFTLDLSRNQFWMRYYTELEIIH